MPEISVIIPAYNRAGRISTTIQSVLDQTFKDFEIIVVDDGSTDDTVKVVTDIKDSRIKCVVLPSNSGTSAHPRNMGIEESSGKYVAFLDSDDTWLPECLELLHRKMINGSADIVYCGLLIIDGKEVILAHPERSGKLFPDMLGNCIVPMNCALISRDVLQLFDTTKGIPPHWDYWIRLSQHTIWDYVPDYLATYNLHPEQYTKKSYNYEKGHHYIYDKYAHLYKRYPAMLRRAKFSLGVTMLLQYRDILGFIKYAVPNMFERHNLNEVIKYIRVVKYIRKKI